MKNSIEVPAAEISPMRRALIVGALGVVYGDIGTSPIYAFRKCLKAAGGVNPLELVLGLLTRKFRLEAVRLIKQRACRTKPHSETGAASR